jgi:uncharacterized protein (DUF2236 family)
MKLGRWGLQRSSTMSTASRSALSPSPGAQSSRGAESGPFPIGASILRTVMEERAVGLFCWQRAVCVGAVWPPNSVGTIRHTKGLLRPFSRFRTTGRMFEAVIFGSWAKANAATAVTRRKHEAVHGRLPNNVGSFPAGTEYSATAPHQMLLTIAPVFDSAQYFYQLFVRRLSHLELDELWLEVVRLGVLFDMPEEAAPASYDEFCEFYKAWLAKDELYLTEEARYLGHAAAFRIPFGLCGLLIRPLHNTVIRGSLPTRIREMYGLRYTPIHALAFRVVTILGRLTRQVAPQSARRGPSGRWFDWVAENEDRRIRRGRPTPQLVMSAHGLSPR